MKLFYNILTLTFALCLYFPIIRGVIRYNIDISLTKRKRKKLERKQSFSEWLFYKRYTNIISKFQLIWYYSSVVIYAVFLVATIISHICGYTDFGRVLLYAYYVANAILLVFFGVELFFDRLRINKTKRENDTNSTSYKQKNNFILYSILGQAIILFFFLPLLYLNKPISVDDCISAQIVVEEKEYNRTYNGHKHEILSNGNRFVFLHRSAFGENIPKENYEALQVGSHMDILYVRAVGLSGEQNLIVEAQSGSLYYLEFDTYNSQQEKIFASILLIFLIIESIFLLSVIFDIVSKKSSVNKSITDL